MIKININPAYSVYIITILSILLYYETAVGDIGRNIAIGASYTFKPAANYTLTKDLADKSQLTDEVYVGGHFWSDKRTVGWQDSGIINIEIDLGQKSIVGNVCVSTARGLHAGVFFPDVMTLFLSIDKTSYKSIGDIYRGTNYSQGSYKKQKFCIGEISTEARYVLLAIKPKGKFTFIDEIEVISGDKKRVISNKNIKKIHKDEIMASVQSHFEARHRNLSILKLIKYVSKNNIGLIDHMASTELDSLKIRIEANTHTDKKQFNEYMSKLFNINRMILRNNYDDILVLSAANPWGRFTPLTLPKNASKLAVNLNFDVAMNGTVSAAIAISNNSDIHQRLKFTVLNTEVNRSPLIQLYEVMFITTSSHDVIADPLKPIKDGYLSLMPGESKQLWLSVNANNITSGDYELNLLIQYTNDKEITKIVPLNIKVWSVLVPEKNGLYVNTWSYLNWRQLKNNINHAINDLNAHHANVAIVHPDQIPWPDFSLHSRLDYSLFDKIMTYQSKADIRLFFMNFTDKARRTFKGEYKYMSTEWKQVFTAWIIQWVEYMKSTGLDYHQYAFYPLDEPKNAAEVKILIDIAKLLKDINPTIRVYTTLGEMSAVDIIRAKDIIDIYQVLIRDIDSISGKQLKFLNKEIWLYTADGGGKDALPHEFYRLQAWRAFQEGVNGIGFWAYADIGNIGNGWNDIDGRRADFSVIYESNNLLYSSKRWEAWREGVEDYYILAAANKKLKANEVDDFYRDMDDVLYKINNHSKFELTRRHILSVASR